MKILYFHQHFSTPKGSGGIRSYAMARRLVDEGHQVTMVTGSNDQGNTGVSGPFKNGVRRGAVDGIQIIELHLPYSNALSLFSRSFLFLRFALRSAALAVFEPADIVFATSTPLTAAIPGIAARLLRGRPFIFEVRDLWPELPEKMGVIKNPFVLKALSLLEFLAYWAASRLIALSPGIRAGILRRLRVEKPVAMIPNGCDLDIFQDKNIEVYKPDELLGSKFTALYSGTLGIANGLDALVDVAKKLVDLNRSDITIAIVGEGREKPRLQERARLLGLTNIVFLNSIPKMKLAGLFKNVQVGLQILADIPAFYYGTSPNKFFDYLSAGLPVVTNYPGWVAELIVDNDCGRAVAPNSPQALAEALIFCADNPSVLAAQSARAINLATSQFNRERLSKNFVQFVVDGAL